MKYFDGNFFFSPPPPFFFYAWIINISFRNSKRVNCTRVTLKTNIFFKGRSREIKFKGGERSVRLGCFMIDIGEKN